MEVIASQMVTERSNAFELEAMSLLKSLDDNFGCLGCNEEVININCNVLIMIIALTHPYITFSFALEET
jgi:hypothetical protein